MQSSKDTIRQRKSTRAECFWPYEWTRSTASEQMYLQKRASVRDKEFASQGVAALEMRNIGSGKKDAHSSVFLVTLPRFVGSAVGDCRNSGTSEFIRIVKRQSGVPSSARKA